MKTIPSKLTRTSSILWHESTRWQGGILIYRAIVWGSQEQVSFEELINLWKSKTRKCDISVMLANVINESSRMPFIARYEIGQHYDNAHFMGGAYFQNPDFEFECTSFGLFQPMGFNLVPKYLNQKNINPFGEFDLGKQLDWFDDFMYNCFELSRKVFPNGNLYQIVYGAIASYAGNPRWYNWIIDKKVKTWRKIEIKDFAFLKSVGFTQSDIDLLC